MKDVQNARLKKFFDQNPDSIGVVVPFNKKLDKTYPFDFTASNTELTPEILQNTEDFSDWVRQKLAVENCRYGIGGYDEHRTIYSRSNHFSTAEEPRRLHAGVDIWGPVGTPVFAPLNGKIHSFKFNDHFGDYGATIIIEHALDEITFHTLYGHLSLASIENLEQGVPITRGQKIGEFGNEMENGHWPPHLHFQLIIDMENMEGDYPGVCRYSEKDQFLANCPDPNMLLKHTF